MVSDTRLDLEAAFSRWRAASALDAETLAELEAHLRDACADGIARGLASDEAFRAALARLGDATQLSDEFSKLQQHRSPNTMNITSLVQSPRLRRLARRLAIVAAIALPLRVFAGSYYPRRRPKLQCRGGQERSRGILLSRDVESPREFRARERADRESSTGSRQGGGRKNDGGISAAAYKVPNASVAPEIPAGSHMIVWRIAPTFAPGDIAAYHDGSKTFLGRVTAVSATELTLTRANKPAFSVPRAEVVGRVVLATR